MTTPKNSEAHKLKANVMTNKYVSVYSRSKIYLL